MAILVLTARAVDTHSVQFLSVFVWVSSVGAAGRPICWASSSPWTPSTSASPPPSGRPSGFCRRRATPSYRGSASHRESRRVCGVLWVQVYDPTVCFWFWAETQSRPLKTSSSSEGNKRSFFTFSFIENVFRSAAGFDSHWRFIGGQICQSCVGDLWPLPSSQQRLRQTPLSSTFVVPPSRNSNSQRALLLAAPPESPESPQRFFCSTRTSLQVETGSTLHFLFTTHSIMGTHRNMILD